MEIRRYRPGEEAAIWAVYYGATRHIVARYYTEQQIVRWAPDDKDMGNWSVRLQKKNPLVAIKDSTIVGFAELEADGHIDCFYCHHEWQRQGIGSQLLAAVEFEALKLRLSELFAEVGLTGIEFFKARGFHIEHHHTNKVCEAAAEQFLVRKKLTDESTLATDPPDEPQLDLSH